MPDADYWWNHPDIREDMDAFRDDLLMTAFLRYVQHDKECVVTGHRCERTPWKTMAGTTPLGCACLRAIEDHIEAAMANMEPIEGSNA